MQLHRRFLPAAALAPAAAALLASAPLAQLGDEPLRFEGAAVHHPFAPHPPARVRPLGVSAELLDLDGDGDRDLARVAENCVDLGRNEAGGLELHAVFDAFAAGFGPGEIALGDRDGDGQEDLFVAGNETQPPHPATVRVLRFDGAGGFALEPAGPQPGWVADPPTISQLDAADLDGDGAAEAVLANLQLAELWSETAGAFPLPNGAWDLRLGDLDGDGDPDAVTLLAQGQENRLQVRANDGAGGFAQATATTGFQRNLTGLALLDADADGALDVAVTQWEPSVLVPNWTDVLLHPGDGAGGLGAPVRSRLLETAWPAWDVEPGDLDGDGVLDLAFALETSKALTSSGLVVVAHGDGAGAFEEAGTISVRTRDLELDDWTGSGAPALVAADGQVIPVDEDGGLGGVVPEGLTFGFATPPIAGLHVLQAAPDFDGDGLADLVTYDPLAGDVRLSRADGESGFEPPQTLASGVLPSTHGFLDMHAADLDGDGLQGVVLVGSDCLVGVPNAGGAPGPAVVTPFPDCGLLEVLGDAVGDVDGDGRADVLTSDFYAPVGVLALGAGDGSFQVGCFGYPELAGELVLADLDADGAVDVATAGRVTKDLWILPGNGDGTFLPGTVTDLPAALGTRLGAGDADGDGDLDLLAGRSTGLALLANDGAGGFAQAQLVDHPLSFRDLFVVDLDEDGDGDLLARSVMAQSSVHLWRNAGGAFELVDGTIDVSSAGSLSHALVELDVADLDGDDLPDLAAAGVTLSPETALPAVYFNRSQLHADGRAEPGAGFDLFVDVPAAAGQPYLILASTEGTWPGTAIAVDTLPLQADGVLWSLVFAGGGGVFLDFVGALDADGRASAHVEVPAFVDPSLAGARLSFAAATYDVSAAPEVRSTNAVFRTLP